MYTYEKLPCSRTGGRAYACCDCGPACAVAFASACTCATNRKLCSAQVRAWRAERIVCWKEQIQGCVRRLWRCSQHLCGIGLCGCCNESQAPVLHALATDRCHDEQNATSITVHGRRSDNVRRWRSGQGALQKFVEAHNVSTRINACKASGFAGLALKANKTGHFSDLRHACVHAWRRLAPTKYPKYLVLVGCVPTDSPEPPQKSEHQTNRVLVVKN